MFGHLDSFVTQYCHKMYKRKCKQMEMKYKPRLQLLAFLGHEATRRWREFIRSDILNHLSDITLTHAV